MSSESFDELRRKTREELEKLRAEALSAPAVVDDNELAHYRDLAGQFTDKLSWAPAIGNGAAMIAMAGIVGNVPSPDTALAALTVPLAIFSAGLLCALVANMFTSSTLDLMDDANTEHEQMKATVREAVEKSIVLADGLAPHNMKERADKIDAVAAELRKNAEQGKELKRRLEWASLKLKASSVLQKASISAVGLGLAYLLIGHATRQLHLEKPTSSRSTSSLARPRAGSIRGCRDGSFRPIPAISDGVMRKFGGRTSPRALPLP